MIIRHLTALLHRTPCDRAVLLPMLDKLTEQEKGALWSLLRNVQDEAQSRSSRFDFPGPLVSTCKGGE